MLIQTPFTRVRWCAAFCGSAKIHLPRLFPVFYAPIRSSVHIPVATLWAHFQGGDVNKGLAELETQAQRMIDDLLWWTTALKTARKAEQ
jgi:hypothetical protein